MTIQRASQICALGVVCFLAPVYLSAGPADSSDSPAHPPEDVFQTDLIAFPGPYAFLPGRSGVVLVSDRQLVDLAGDPDKQVNISLSATPRLQTLRQICERARQRGHRVLSIAFDYFWAAYRKDVKGVPRRLWPDMDRYIELIGKIGRFARPYGLGIEISLLSPLEIGHGYRKTTGESGRWLHYREGLRDPATGAYSVQLWRQLSWTNNKGTIRLQDAGVRVFAFRERRVGGTPYYVVDPSDIVEISDTAKVEVLYGKDAAAPVGYSAVRIRIHGAGRKDVGHLDRVLAVQVYTTPEMDYFSDSARPFLHGLIDRYVKAQVHFRALYADESHIQGDWGYFRHHDHGEFAVRYVSPGLEKAFAARYGAQYADFAKWMVYFARGQHDSANDLTATSGAMHVLGPKPADIQRTALLRARYYHFLEDGVVDLFVDAKEYLERRMGHQVHSRAHATWAQSPTIDAYDAGQGSAHAEKYEYTTSFVWSNTVHQAACACYDYFKWGEFLHGTGNDTAEGGWLDRDYWGFALASSLGVLNRVRNAYAAHWGMPAAVARRRSALRDAWGTAPSRPFGIVENLEHREVDVLMLYPIDLVAADERFGSWMTQYAYANWITQAELLERGRVAGGALQVAGRRYHTLAATFEPFPAAGLLKMMEQLARGGGRVIWSGPPPVLTAEGGDAVAAWRRLTGARWAPRADGGAHAAGRRIEFEGILGAVGPMTVLTDYLPDRVYEVEPVSPATAVARIKGKAVGTHRRLEGGGTVTFLGFRPRDDQSMTMGYDERHWFEILQALGAYPASGRFPGVEDNTEYVSRTTDLFTARFPNGAVAIAPHLRHVEESWPGGFHRDRAADAKIAARLDLPPEHIKLDGLKIGGHGVVYEGERAVAFRVNGEGRLIAFAGHGSPRIAIDGKETVFADRPLPLVAWAPVPEERRVAGGAVLQVCAAGDGELRIPAPGLRAAAVFREGATAGSRGTPVESRMDDGRLVFRSSGGLGWYYAVPAGGTAAGGAAAGRRTDTFNAGWRFAAGENPDAAKPPFDDSSWQPVCLPHDWAICGPFDPAVGGRTAKLPWRGVGWYRKHFRLRASDKGRRVYLDFDGVMAFPRVYVNGHLAGEWDYGYMSFRVDASEHVEFGRDNVVAVRADTTRHGSRWYPGAGIYRRVAITVCDPVHVAHWGTRVATPRVTDERASVRIETVVENHLDSEAPVAVEVIVLDPGGRRVAGGREEASIAAGGSRAFRKTLTVEKPLRWDVKTPRLYTARVTVRRDARACDVHDTSFGIRTMAFTPDDGFHLNGRRVQLQGVDLHHGHGPLGAAFFPRAMERQLEIMKDMGANALRTSHNPPAPELLDLCDRMGILVFDEGFDKWNQTAGLQDPKQFEPFMRRQVPSFVRRDRNHPSVMIWSIGNEIWDVESNRGGDAPQKVALMVDLFKQNDPTRPVTFGCLVPGAVREDTHVLDALDVTSWNYGRKYVNARKRYPDKPIIYSESASALSTRAFYKLPHPKEKTDYKNPELQVDSYDLNAASGPRDIPDWDFWRMETDRYVAGEFVWTGFDYLGEPTPFPREARSSYFGIVDLCGIPKDRFYLYRSHWRPETTTVHILPHWNWPDRAGKTVPVYVYTNGDSADLFLNGRLLGRRRKASPELRDPSEKDSRDAEQDRGDGLSPYYRVIDRYRLRWEDVPYEPGELRAVAYRGGRKIGEAVMKTAGPPARLRLTPDRKEIRAGANDLSYVLVEMLDADGVPCPLAGDMVHFSVKGPGRIAGIGNGNPLGLDPFCDAKHPLFFGKAMLILRSVEGRAGEVSITARAQGVESASVEIRTVR